VGARRSGGRDPAERWRDAISALGTWQRAGTRAVHKPLLTLLLIARAARGDGARVAFEEIEPQLDGLLREFGPPRKSYHPEYPFWHLQSDGIWKVEAAESFALRKSGRSPSKKTLLNGRAIGSVPDAYWASIAKSPALRSELVSTVLNDYWPATYHDALRQALGLPQREPVRQAAPRSQRDPRFRELVLRAYERRCAICGYDGRLGRDDLALEAAHVRWHCYDGPDEVSNGLALCSFHHAALDRGALGMTDDHRILVSRDVHGTEMVDDLLLRFSNAPLRRPQSGLPAPAVAHLRWHTRQVFRAPARSSA